MVRDQPTVIIMDTTSQQGPSSRLREEGGLYPDQQVGETTALASPDLASWASP